MAYRNHQTVCACTHHGSSNSLLTGSPSPAMLRSALPTDLNFSCSDSRTMRERFLSYAHWDEERQEWVLSADTLEACFVLRSASPNQQGNASKVDSFLDEYRKRSWGLLLRCVDVEDNGSISYAEFVVAVALLTTPLTAWLHGFDLLKSTRTPPEPPSDEAASGPLMVPRAGHSHSSSAEDRLLSGKAFGDLLRAVLPENSQSILVSEACGHIAEAKEGTRRTGLGASIGRDVWSWLLTRGQDRGPLQDSRLDPDQLGYHITLMSRTLSSSLKRLEQELHQLPQYGKLLVRRATSNPSAAREDASIDGWEGVSYAAFTEYLYTLRRVQRLASFSTFLTSQSFSHSLNRTKVPVVSLENFRSYVLHHLDSENRNIRKVEPIDEGGCKGSVKTPADPLRMDGEDATAAKNQHLTHSSGCSSLNQRYIDWLEYDFLCTLMDHMDEIVYTSMLAERLKEAQHVPNSEWAAGPRSTFRLRGSSASANQDDYVTRSSFLEAVRIFTMDKPSYTDWRRAAHDLFDVLRIADSTKGATSKLSVGTPSQGESLEALSAQALLKASQNYRNFYFASLRPFSGCRPLAETGYRGYDERLPPFRTWLKCVTG